MPYSQDNSSFRVVQGKVEPMPMMFEAAYGSVRPLPTPEDFDAIRAAVRDERAAKSSAI